jgi:hypothetical protein
MGIQERFEVAVWYSTVLAIEGNSLRARAADIRRRAADLCERSRAARARCPTADRGGLRTAASIHVRNVLVDHGV